MRALTAAQMREADRRCIEDLGIPGAVLMNNAGTAVFREIDRAPIGIVCGKGNNGGDGFVVARLCLLARQPHTTVLLAPFDDLSGDARLFLNVYRRLGGSVRTAASEKEAAEAVAGLSNRALLVDAILGTGIRGNVRGAAAAAIDAWPNVRTIAVDIPSGMDSDTGKHDGRCIRADVTVTFQFPKVGFEQREAKPYLGKLIVADIGIPDVCADDEAWSNRTRVE
jgi:hydroxyethylthiazole kinase-like uncharacterized protein yjeF